MLLVSNLLGLAGLIAVAVATGGLTGNWWWSLLVGGLAVTALAVMAQRNATAVDEAETAGSITATGDPAVRPVPRLVDRVSRSA